MKKTKIHSNNSDISEDYIKLFGSNNMVFTSNSSVNGNNSVIVGNNNKVKGSNNDVKGDYNNVKGNNNTIKGSNNKCTGSNNRNMVRVSNKKTKKEPSFFLILITKIYNELSRIIGTKIDNYKKKKEIIVKDEILISGYYDVYLTKEHYHNGHLTEIYYDSTNGKWDNHNIIIDNPYGINKKNNMTSNYNVLHSYGTCKYEIGDIIKISGYSRTKFNLMVFDGLKIKNITYNFGYYLHVDFNEWCESKKQLSQPNSKYFSEIDNSKVNYFNIFLK